MTNKRVVIAGIVVAAVVLCGVILLAISVKKLDSTDVALMYDTVAKVLDPAPKYEGLYPGPPGFKFIIFPSTFRSKNYEYLKCLNKDGVEIELDISYQYRIRGDAVYNITLEFGDYEGYLKALSCLGESAIHDSCAQFNTSQYQSERGAFQEYVRQRTVTSLTLIATEITDVQVNDIRRPRKYEDAVKAKESAREDIEVAEQERPRQLTEAQTTLRQAETLADITTDKAESQARITRMRSTAQVAAILDQYDQETEAYKNLVSSTGLNLNTQAFLAYLGVRVIEEAKSPVYISMKAPAKASYMTS